MTPTEILIAAVIGLVAGVVGGLCGIGGSIIMLPALALVFGYDLPDGEPDATRNAHHLYMAAAAMVNVVVAATSIRPHLKAKAIDRAIVLRLVPPMAIASIGGVVVSNRLPGSVPKLALIVFLFLFVAWTLFTAIRKLPEPTPEQQRATATRVGGIGTLAGFLAGFLAIGGGIVLVPSMQIIARISLRRAIAASRGGDVRGGADRCGAPAGDAERSRPRLDGRGVAGAGDGGGRGDRLAAGCAADSHSETAESAADGRDRARHLRGEDGRVLLRTRCGSVGIARVVDPRVDLGVAACGECVPERLFVWLDGEVELACTERGRVR
ncbi:MAG: sulfite exporter TauE/SafE family protein [Planctomycetota bacterium]|nr:MAG: sulfite exporter TauE/SafE family protein [Planctomycetota bacterium]